MGRLGRNSHPRGRNLARKGTQGEVGVSLKTFIQSPHNSKLWCHYTITASYFSFHLMAKVCVMAIVFTFKLIENDVILRYNFSLPDCHFSLIFLEG